MKRRTFIKNAIIGIITASVSPKILVKGIETLSKISAPIVTKWGLSPMESSAIKIFDDTLKEFYLPAIKKHLNQEPLLMGLLNERMDTKKGNTISRSLRRKKTD